MRTPKAKSKTSRKRKVTVWEPGHYPDALHVAVDSRERLPLLFPLYLDWEPTPGEHHRFRLKTESLELAAGDYCLLDFPTLVGIERKYSTREIHTNLFTLDRARALAAFARMKYYTNRYLMLDCSIADFLSTRSWENRVGKESFAVTVDPGQICDRLFFVCASLGIQLWFPGKCYTMQTRRRLGEAAVRMMLAHVHPHLTGKQDQ